MTTSFQALQQQQFVNQTQQPHSSNGTRNSSLTMLQKSPMAQPITTQAWAEASSGTGNNSMHNNSLNGVNSSTSQQRVRSNNKQGGKSSLGTIPQSAPWTPERANGSILHKSTSQLPKKTLFNLSANNNQMIAPQGSITQRSRLDVGASSPMQDKSGMHQIMNSQLPQKTIIQKTQTNQSSRNSLSQKSGTGQVPQRSSSASYTPSSQNQTKVESNVNTSSSVEKIKALKVENKKLVALLRDSEKLFYQKLKETQKESENMNTVFKQVWPLIKHKVKDPDGLLKGIINNDITGHEQLVDTLMLPSSPQESEVMESLRHEIQQLKTDQTIIQEELQAEREQRQMIENLLYQQQTKINEMLAFQQTVQAYTMHTSPHSHCSPNNKFKQAKPLTASTMDSTQAEMIPSFLKALYLSEDGLEDESNVIGSSLEATESARGVLIDANRSKSAMANPLKDFTFNKSQQFGVANQQQPLKTNRERESLSSSRPSSAMHMLGSTMQPKPPRDRSNPALPSQTKIVQQNNYFQLVTQKPNGVKDLIVQNTKRMF